MSKKNSVTRRSTFLSSNKLPDVDTPDKTGCHNYYISIFCSITLILSALYIIQPEFVYIHTWKDIFTNRLWYHPIITVMFLGTAELIPDIKLGILPGHKAIGLKHAFLLEDAWYVAMIAMTILFYFVNYGLVFIQIWLCLQIVAVFVIPPIVFVLWFKYDDNILKPGTREFWHECIIAKSFGSFMAICSISLIFVASYLENNLLYGWDNSVMLVLVPLLGDGCVYLIHRNRHIQNLHYGSHMYHHSQPPRITDPLHFISPVSDTLEAGVALSGLFVLFPGVKINMHIGYLFFICIGFTLTAIVEHDQRFYKSPFTFVAGINWFHQIHHLCGHIYDVNHSLLFPIWDIIWGTSLEWKNVPIKYKLTAVEVLEHTLQYPKKCGLPGYDLISQKLHKMNKTERRASVVYKGEDIIDESGCGEEFNEDALLRARDRGRIILVLKGGVYDLTDFSNHPGGRIVFQDAMKCPTTAQTLFDNARHSNWAKNEATDWYKGVFIGTDKNGDEIKFESLADKHVDLDDSFKYLKHLQPSMVSLGLLFFTVCGISSLMSWYDIYTHRWELLQDVEGNCLVSALIGLSQSNNREAIEKLISMYTDHLCICVVTGITFGILLRSPYILRKLYTFFFYEEFVLDSDIPVDLKLIKKRRLTRDLVEFTFEIPGGKSIGLKTGQHIALCAKSFGANGIDIQRSYTPVDINAHGLFRVVMKIYPDGKMSQYMNGRYVGDRISFKGPLGNFVYEGNGVFSVNDVKMKKLEHFFMIVGGSGATPGVQLIQHVVTEDPNKTMQLTVLFCASTPDDFVLMDDCIAMADSHDNIHLHFAASGFTDPNDAAYWNYFTGRINPNIIRQIFPTSTNVAIGYCGPPKFEEAVVGILSDKEYKIFPSFRY